MENFLFAVQGSISIPAADADAAQDRLDEFLHQAGALAEQFGFHVYYLRQSPTDPEQPGYVSQINGEAPPSRSDV